MSRTGGVRWYSDLPGLRILVTSAGLVAVLYLSVVLDLALHSNAAETGVLRTVAFYLAYFGVILSPLLLGGLVLVAAVTVVVSAVVQSRPSASPATAAMCLTAAYGAVMALVVVAMESGWWIRTTAWTLGVGLAGWLFHRTLHAASERAWQDISDESSKSPPDPVQ